MLPNSVYCFDLRRIIFFHFLPNVLKYMNFMLRYKNNLMFGEIMKKVFQDFKFFALLVSVFFVFALISCSDISSSKENSSVTFTVSSSSIKDALFSKSARVLASEATEIEEGAVTEEIDSETTEDEDLNPEIFVSASLKIALYGDYSSEKILSFTYEDFAGLTQKTVTFTDVPVGARVTATAILYGTFNTYTMLFYAGSESTTIKSGTNPLSIKLEDTTGDSEELSPVAYAADEDGGVYTLFLSETGNYYVGHINLSVESLSAFLSDAYSSSLTYSFLSIGSYEGFKEDSDGNISSLTITEKFYLNGSDYEIIENPKSQNITVSDNAFTLQIENGKSIEFKLFEESEGRVSVSNDVKIYTISENTDDSTDFFLNRGTFAFSLLDEEGNDVLGDVDWEQEQNQSLLSVEWAFQKGNVLIPYYSGENNTFSILEDYPLTAGGTYYLTVYVSPSQETYINTSGDTVDFPEFEPVSATFKITVIDEE